MHDAVFAVVVAEQRSGEPRFTSGLALRTPTTGNKASGTHKAPGTDKAPGMHTDPGTDMAPDMAPRMAPDTGSDKAPGMAPDTGPDMAPDTVPGMAPRTVADTGHTGPVADNAAHTEADKAPPWAGSNRNPPAPALPPQPAMS